MTAPGRCRPGRRGTRRAPNPACRASAATAVACPAPSSSTARPPGLQQARQRGQDRAVGVEPVRPAIQRARRLERGDLRHQAGDVGRWRYRAGCSARGRTARRSARPSRRRRWRPGAARPSAAALAAASAAAAGLRSMPTPQAAGNSVSAASSRQPVPVPRSSTLPTPCRVGPPARPRSASRCRRAGSAWPARPGSAGSRTPGQPRMSAIGSRAARRASRALVARPRRPARPGSREQVLPAQPGGMREQQPGFQPRRTRRRRHAARPARGASAWQWSRWHSATAPGWHYLARPAAPPGPRRSARSTISSRSPCMIRSILCSVSPIRWSDTRPCGKL